MTPRLAEAQEDFGAILALIRDSFAYMERRINPPSSMHRLTEAGIAEAARMGEVWLIGAPVLACMFLTQQPGRLYVGKIAVAESERQKGHARALLAVAEARARALGLPKLVLETRVELSELHETYRALGFHEAGRHAHPGFDRDTTVLFVKPVT